MTLLELKEKLKHHPKKVDFSETIAVIENQYSFTPTAFKNGEVNNEAGKNSGSCKIFAFAVKQALSNEETLACFGNFYFDEVLNDPSGEGHQNIRNFMKTGFEGLHFYGEALIEK